MLKNALFALKTQGIGGFARAVYNRFVPDRLQFFGQCRPLIESKTGFELGGPSGVFGPRGIVPAYAIAARIDNCNFGARTMWEGQVTAGDTFTFAPDKPTGKQFVAEASDLPFITDAQYDFVLSSHCLEHLANPLQGLHEWIRILKPGGLLVLVLPHRDGTFDRKRPVTQLAHMVQDFDSNMSEHDLTHVDEILKLHDLSMDPEAGDPAQFAERCRKNFENRGLHHHVFDTRRAAELVDHVGLQILAVESFRPYHIVIIAQKPGVNARVDNQAFLASKPAWNSPFPSDQSALN